MYDWLNMALVMGMVLGTLGIVRGIEGLSGPVQRLGQRLGQHQQQFQTRHGGQRA